MEQVETVIQERVPSLFPGSKKDLGWFERIARATAQGEGPVTVRREDLQRMLSTLVMSVAIRE